MATKNLSIMFTDIKGFTARTSGETREGINKWMAEHDRLLIPVFKYFDGKIVKTIGDAFLVVFESPTDAVLCGVTIQEVLRQYNKTNQEGEVIKVRVAVNVGEVEIKDNDVLGEAVNIAARLESIAEAGEVYFTDAVFQTMNRHEAPSAEVGEKIFKGIPHPIKVYKVINDPGSDLAQTLTEGVSLSKKGPVIEGIRDHKNWKKTKWLHKGLIAALLIMIIAAASFFLVPSKAEKICEQAEILISQKEYRTAMSLTHELIMDEPHNKILKTTCTRAAGLYLDTLLEAGESEQALKWLQEELKIKPYLEELRPRIAMVDAEVTMNKLLAAVSKHDYYPPELKELLDRHPKNAEMAFWCGKSLEGKWSTVTVIWLYNLAMKNDLNKNNHQRIFDYCIKCLSQGSMNFEKFRKATKTLLNYFPDETVKWAENAIKGNNVMAIFNSWRLLKKQKNKIIEQPYIKQLMLLVHGSDIDEKQLASFSRIEGDEKRNQIIAVHQEIIDTFPKFTAYGNKKKKLSANIKLLKKQWVYSLR
jgi:class 3 adenylate cyclase